MSALPPKADMCSALGDVRFVPIADIVLLKRADPMTTLFHQPSNGSHCRRRRAEEAKATFGEIPHDAEAPNMPTGLRTRGGAGLQLFLEVGVRSGSDT